MPERLLQLTFDETFNRSVPQDVTPEGFTGLAFPEQERVSRFVREVRESVHVHSPVDAAQYLLTKVSVPFADFDQEDLWVLLPNPIAVAGVPFRIDWDMGVQVRD